MSVLPSDGGHILLVDDSPLVLDLLADKLSAHGYRVMQATSGKDALEIALKSAHEFDLFLLDVLMPSMDGHEIARELRKFKTTKDVPILLLTSLGATEDKVTGLEAGADDFMTKTISDPEMLARVRSLISIGRQRQRLARERETIARFVHGEDVGTDDKQTVIGLVACEPEVLARFEQLAQDSRTRNEAATTVVQQTKTLPTSQDAGGFDVVVVGFATATKELGFIDKLQEFDVPPAIIVFDDQPSPARRIEALDAGVDDYIGLDVPLEELQARIASARRRRQRYQRIQETRDQAVMRAITDPLTKIYNRGYFNEVAQLEVHRAKRYQQAFSIALFDVDHFKDVNDEHGHAVGDAVLIEVAACLSRTLRNIDTVGRYGGEEFVALLPHTSASQAFSVAERMRTQIEATSFGTAGGKAIRVTISVGVATYPNDASSCESLVQAADMALYVAKRNGRNQVVLSSSQTSEAGADELPLSLSWLLTEGTSPLVQLRRLLNQADADPKLRLLAEELCSYIEKLHRRDG